MHAFSTPKNAGSIILVVLVVLIALKFIGPKLPEAAKSFLPVIA